MIRHPEITATDKTMDSRFLRSYCNESKALIISTGYRKFGHYSV